MDKKRIAIITDSSSGYKNEQFPDFYVLPLIINVENKNSENGQNNTKSYKENECDQKQMMEWLEDKNYTITTSQASAGEIIDLLDRLTDSYDEIYVLPITKTVSGSENTWQIVASEYRNVYIIKNHMGGPMFKFFIDDFIKARDEGILTKDWAEEYAEIAKSKIIGIMVVNSPRFLFKGGRLGRLSGYILNSINSKIMVSLDVRGMRFYKILFSAKSINNKILKYFENSIKNELKPELIKDIMFIENKLVSSEEIEDTKKWFKNIYGNSSTIYEEQFPNVLMAHAGSDALIVAIKFKDPIVLISENEERK